MVIKDDGDVAEDKFCHGLPSTSSTEENIKNVKEMELKSHHATVGNISRESFSWCFVDVLGMRHVLTGFLINLYSVQGIYDPIFM